MEKVSVIVPVFNAEKYLAVCLESLLIQTFTDFEVILVDDCSTDSSMTIAESYLEKFGGRLKILTLEENTGSGAVPRNIGLEFSRGKYIFFMDSDDLLIDNALETLYNFAEEYRADVVYMEKGFQCGAEIVPQNVTEVFWNPPRFTLQEPILETEKISERAEKFLKLAFGSPSWEKFLRRDFLIDNDIKFPSIKISEDIIWTFKVVCTAKRFLRLPQALYIWRSNETSMTRRTRSPEEELIFWMNPLITGLDCLEEFMAEIEFFKLNPTYRFAVLKFFATIQFDFMAEAIKALEPQEVYEIFLREFAAAGSSQPALISYLLTMNNLYRNELSK